MRYRLAAVLVRLALLGAMAGSVFGCAAHTMPTDTLRWPLLNEPDILDPARATDTNSGLVINNVFEGLVRFNTSNQLVPNLAESWDVSDDRMTYTFHVRRGVKFHNGREMVADDVAYSINRCMADALSSVRTLYLNDIVGARAVFDGKAAAASGITVIDPNTLRIRIDAPKAYFLAKLAYPTAYVVCREAIEAGGLRWTEAEMRNGEIITNCIGTGPYRVAEWQHSVRVRLKAFDDYWRGRPKTEWVDFPVVSDQQSRLSRYQADELDATDVTSAQYPELSQDPRLEPELRNETRLSITYLALNTLTYPPFKDRRVRRAFAYAIDQQLIAHVALNDVFKPAEGILPPGMPAFDPNFKGIPFDPKEAGRLIREAGYDPQTHPLPPLELQYANIFTDLGRIAPTIAEMLKSALGVEIQLQRSEWNTFLRDTREGRPPSYLLGWIADYIDPQDFLTIMLHSESENNRTGYSNPAFDRLCNQGDVEADPEKRMALYTQANRMAIEDAPWVTLYYGSDPRLIKARVRGAESNLMGWLPFLNVELAPK